MGFDIYEQIEPINHDLTISFTPDLSYQSYKLTIIKNEEIYKEINKINANQAQINLSETGIYKIQVTYNENEIISSGIYIIDKEAPIIEINKNYIELKIGQKFDIMRDVSATDNMEGNLTNQIQTNTLNLQTPGVQKLIYTVSDKAGNETTKELIINVIETSPTVIIFQTLFMIFLFFAVILILIYNKSIKLEEKISRFSISPLKDNTISLFDNISERISNLINKINKPLYKSEFIKKYSKKYTKYIRTSNQISKTSMDFISIKIICSIISLIIAIFSKTIRFKIFHIYDIYIPLLFGFFIPDFVYYFKYKYHKKKMENQLLEAIIIMNNAFKSGRSIVQAIDLVSNELDGTMAEEFKKMHLELSFGLSLDIVFKRFSERVKIEEVAYLTASLTILNKTGGNIIEVFSSIEKSLFNKKKLNLELKSLTSGSRMIVKVLIFVPIAFIALIGIINPSYFLPLLTNKIGYIIIAVITLYYIIYIIVIRKLLKVKI